MTKQVALADATYARLKRHKRPEESFSQAIERLLDQDKDPLAFPGGVPKAPISSKEWLAEIKAGRDATSTVL